MRFSKMPIAMWACLLIQGLIGNVQCQSSPSELAGAAVKHWAGNSEAAFDAVFPFREGRAAFSEMAEAQFDRVAGLAKVVQASHGRAILLISGVPLMENSGDATIESRGFSGLYEAREEGGRWVLATRIPLDNQGRILAQRLSVRVRPGYGIDVEDRIRIRVEGNRGFAVRLNYRANLQQVKANKAAVKYLFGGGLLWMKLPPGETAVTLTYSIEVEQGPNETNSGCFLRKAGHVRNQYFWHPFFDFSSAGDQAEIEIEARIPKEYKLSTSLPQTEHIEGAERVIDGKMIRPTFALTITYDREWKTVTENVGGLRLQLLLTPEFKPSPAAVVQEFRSVYSLLSSQFGVPKATYFGIVQARSIQGNGWLFASNQVVVAAGWPRILSTKDGFPRAFLGHEIGHLWTNGSGAAANFLGEGWATYVESLVLANEFGADTVQQFWNKESEAYFKDYDGKVSILEDQNNDGVAYPKGAWVFRMLNEVVGKEAFQKAMTEYSSRSLERPADWDVLAECFQHQGVQGFDARAFLTPWLKEKSAPSLTAQAKGDRVILHQVEPFFALPVTVEATTSKGIERRTVWIHEEEAVIPFDPDVSNPQVDPDGLLLLRR